MAEHFKEFILQKEADGLAEATITGYCYALKDYYQWLTKNRIETATENDIRDYFIYLRTKQYSPVTIKDKYIVIKAYYNYCVRHGYREKTPVQIKRPPIAKKQARCFTDDEIEKILQYYKNKETFTQLRDYTIMCILFATGIRRAELLNIQTVQNDWLIITGKGNKTRSVPISASLRSVLNKYIKEREKHAVCPFLIITKDGQKMTANGLRAIFTRLANGTGLQGKRISSHTWRHTYATNFLKNGGDILTLQKILGHEDIQTTSIYLHWNDAVTASINERANPLNKFKKIF